MNFEIVKLKGRNQIGNLSTYFFEIKFMTFLLSKSGLFAGKLRKTDLVSTRKKNPLFF